MEVGTLILIFCRRSLLGLLFIAGVLHFKQMHGQTHNNWQQKEELVAKDHWSKISKTSLSTLQSIQRKDIKTELVAKLKVNYLLLNVNTTVKIRSKRSSGAIEALAGYIYIRLLLLSLFFKVKCQTVNSKIQSRKPMFISSPSEIVLHIDTRCYITQAWWCTVKNLKMWIHGGDCLGATSFLAMSFRHKRQPFVETHH